MLHYLSNLNAIPLCHAYNDLRNTKLAQLLYLSKVLLFCELMHSDFPKTDAIEKAIPEFLKYNIIELDIQMSTDNTKVPRVALQIYVRSWGHSF